MSPRSERSSVAVLLVLVAFVLGAVARDAAGRPGPDAPSPPERVDEFAGWFHDAGNLLLHMSNRGRFGGAGADPTAPSAEWPAGSNHEYLYAGGLWVGGVVGPDTLVTSGLYQFGEFANREPDEGCGNPPEGICVTAEGAASGVRRFDDDGDGMVDEDPLDGADNDSDGRVDEDFAAISNQMFRATFYDTSTAFNIVNPDTANHHIPLGLEVTQESYVWTHPTIDDFVGVEFTFRNMSQELDGVGWTIGNVYVGMMMDGDVGVDGTTTWNDDYGAYTDSLRIAYMFDGTSTSGDNVPGYLGVMLLGASVGGGGASGPAAVIDSRAAGAVEVHVYRLWSSGAEDPTNDLDRYHMLRGVSDVVRSIDPPATREDDWRYLISTGPFGDLAPGATLQVQFAFVAGDMTGGLPDPSGPAARAQGTVPDFANAVMAQRVFDGVQDGGETVHWTGTLAPAAPNRTVTPGNGLVTLEWDDFPETVPDGITGELDFAGYRVERAGPYSDTGVPPEGDWRVVAEWDTSGLGAIDTGNPGIGKYRWVNRGLRNFRSYWYRVVAWDRQEWTSEASAVRVRPEADSRLAPDDVVATPNPYRTSVEAGAPVRFLGAPPEADIRVYGVDGRLVAALPPGRTEWAPEASGVYLWRVRTPDGGEAGGKIVVLK